MRADLRLPAELTIYTATSTRQAWLGTLAAPGDGALRVDAADVSEIDAAGLQLLVSLRRSLAARERALCLLEPSAALAGACQRAGLGELLMSQEPA